MSTPVKTLDKSQKLKLKRLVEQALAIQVSQKRLKMEEGETKKAIEALMVYGGLDVVETDLVTATRVAGAKIRKLDKGALVKKLSYSEFASIAEPKLSEVEKLLSAEELSQVVTESTGNPYITIREKQTP